MTLEELKKVKFHMVAHLSMAKEHQCTYADESGRLGFCDITKKKNEFEFGESKRAYRIDSTWYDTKEEFVKALERFGFGPQLPVKGGDHDK
jgi:hypothetical protein